MKHALSRLLLLILLSFYIGAAIAEATFITDKINVDVYSLQNNKGVIVKSVAGGTPVKVLKTEGDYQMIRTSDNKAGWVPTIQVTTEKPVKIEYLQLLARYEELNKTLSKVKDNSDSTVALDKALAKKNQALTQAQKNLANSKAQIKKLQVNLKAKDSETISSKTALDELKQQIAVEKEKLSKANAEIAAQTALQTPSDPAQKSNDGQLFSSDTQNGGFAVALRWFIIGLLITLIMGFMLGKRWVDDKIRKRHGGLRLY